MVNHQRALQNFEREVVGKYSIYNSIFLTLPFGEVKNTGVLLPLLVQECVEGYKKKKSPDGIIRAFFRKQPDIESEEEKISLLFRFIQYIERQVVLFDSLEDAAFGIVNNTNGVGTVDYLHSESIKHLNMERVREKLDDFRVRIVLTAHPTQFYPDSVLGIIGDLTNAIKRNDLTVINQLLQQLGKTPFFKYEKPTPYDEALSLMWYLENVFYQSISEVQKSVKHQFFNGDLKHPVIEMGFWPGGDRDGNPFVNAQTTLRVADELRSKILHCYYQDIERLEKRLTFRGVEKPIAALKEKIHQNVSGSVSKPTMSKKELLDELLEIRQILIDKHNGLFVEFVDDFMDKVRIFGYHFASLDIRQDSRVHSKVMQDVVKTYHDSGDYSIFPKNYAKLSVKKQIEVLAAAEDRLVPSVFVDVATKDVFESIYAIKEIQYKNGSKGAHRYIISNCQNAVNVMEVLALLRIGVWKLEELTVDIVPLFETIDDLADAPNVMRTLFKNEVYRGHVTKRGNYQTIMLGFSDGTKDGGYLQANWSIFKAKEELSKVAREFDVKVMFFDGRGGPPARGGGKTNRFYSSLGKNIENKAIEMTIQGQTISSNFGMPVKAQYNIEQMLTAGVTNELFDTEQSVLSKNDRKLLDELAGLGYNSRPSKRGSGKRLKFENLRAIPFVGSWSQLKQNVPGFYGVGTGLQHFKEDGRWEEMEHLYQSSSFFRALLQNTMMSLTKCFFPLTEYMKKDEEFGEFWSMIHDEYKLTKKILLDLTKSKVLMSEAPEGRRSIEMREQIVLPLLTIQQYALRKLQELEKNEASDPDKIETYKKMVARSLYGNINASRNSA